MGLRTKFNLALAAVAIFGVAAFALASTPVLSGLAREEVLQSARIMMDGAMSARSYTSAQIAPILEPGMTATFRPQAVSAYAAKQIFAAFREKVGDYSYREAALNPTNPDDRAADWEADIIQDFRNHPHKSEMVGERATPAGETLYLARPISAAPACLACHSTPAQAPQSMLALYGPDHGFGWTRGEVVAAQIVSVPAALAAARAAQVRAVLFVPFLAVFALLFVLLNLMLDRMVVTPVDRLAKMADAVSLGDLDTPPYVRAGTDQIARLSGAINRMRRSLQEALKMLSDG